MKQSQNFYSNATASKHKVKIQKKNSNHNLIIKKEKAFSSGPMLIPCVVFTFLIFLVMNTPLLSQPTYVWGKQFSNGTVSRGVSIAEGKEGNLFITGNTLDELYGTSQGDLDAFIAKFDTSGNKIWGKQFGTSNTDYTIAMDTDSADNINVTGWTQGTINGNKFGSYDIFFYKYDKNGNQLKQSIFGTSTIDVARGIHVDNSGNIYIVGFTDGNFHGNNQGGFDCIIIKLDPETNEVFRIQFGSAGSDFCNDIITDDSLNFYITGEVNGLSGQEHFGGSDAFVAKYSEDGVQQWIKIYGTPEDDIGQGILRDKMGNIIVSGNTRGSLAGENQGNLDNFILKQNSNGELVWKKQFGPTSTISSGYMTFDNSESENIILCGDVNDKKGAFIRMYNGNGEVIWNQYFSNGDYSRGPRIMEVLVSKDNYIYTACEIWDVGVFSEAGKDVILTKFDMKDAPKCPINIQNSINETIFNAGTENNFSIPLDHIISDIENDELQYTAFIKGTNNYGTWMGPNSTTLLFDASPEIESIYSDTALHDAVVRRNRSLPSWLEFNSSTLEFTGAPEKTDTLEIVLIIKNSTKYVISDEFTISVKAPITAIKKNTGNQISIYPNPSKGIINIETNIKTIQGVPYKLIDMNGQLLQTGMLQDSSIDVSTIKRGLYLLKLNINGEVLYQKVLLK